MVSWTKVAICGPTRGWRVLPIMMAMRRGVVELGVLGDGSGVDEGGAAAMASGSFSDGVSWSFAVLIPFCWVSFRGAGSYCGLLYGYVCANVIEFGRCH